jgi:anti-sigma factor RsiW
MRNSRFIELLNLYVDQQLSSKDASDLEAAIAENPARRRTYEQYCRMQKACAVLFEQERSVAPSSRLLSVSLLEADRKIQRPHKPVALNRIFFPVGIAAAACLVLVLGRRPDSTRSGLAAIEQAAPAMAVSKAAPAEAKTVPVQLVSLREATVAPRINLYSVFTSRPPANAAMADDNSGDLVTEGANESNVSVAWMRDLELAPIATPSDRLTLKPVSATFEGRASRNRRSNGPTAEAAAFQFQR